MKKTIPSRWEKISYIVIMTGTVATVTQRLITGWPSYPFVLGLAIASVVYIGALLFHLKRENKLRRIVYILHCILATLYLAFIYHGSQISTMRAAYAFSTLIYAAIITSIMQFIFWLRKRHRAKCTPPSEH